MSAALLRPVIDPDPDVAYFHREGLALDERTIGALQDLARVAGFVGASDVPAALTAGEREELERLLRQTPGVEQEGRFAWRLDERRVDFSWVFDQSRPAERVEVPR